ncbi:peptide methionine sulfoxide reductase [Enterococcus avium]|uniref:peptide methionine sulfoxide reductase n=1 Tax=Enterococcus avium TaxID=33945 RepID=UPI00288EDBC9|nr:peptide methionine sulfoxide reductase [Enterococcus avium]MDT2485057.1 peptide methionine sulfoxide reductase [Enterococcus avium]MDT2511643.1 peptide methionine sulfoxide reductase [Enterococcus avium]
MDFISYFFEADQDERVYNQWLHTSMTQSFKDFKKEQDVQTIRKKKIETPLSKEEESQRLAFATQFIKPKQKSEVK